MIAADDIEKEIKRRPEAGRRGSPIKLELDGPRPTNEIEKKSGAGKRPGALLPHILPISCLVPAIARKTAGVALSR
jgi:hypothetical protein